MGIRTVNVLRLSLAYSHADTHELVGFGIVAVPLLEAAEREKYAEAALVQDPRVPAPLPQAGKTWYEAEAAKVTPFDARILGVLLVLFWSLNWAAEAL